MRKGATNFKLPQQNALMGSFWRAVDASYFQEAQSGDLLGGLEALQGRRLGLSVPRFELALPQNLVARIGGFFAPRAFGGSGSEEVNRQNYQNFLRHFVVSALAYGKLLGLLKSQFLPCESCVGIFAQTLEQKFGCVAELRGSPRQDLKALEGEAKALDRLIARNLPGLCKDCNRQFKGATVAPSHPRQSADNQLRPWKQLFRENQARTAQLLLRLSHGITLENRLRSRAVVAFELEVQKDYLLMSLLKLEQKLLADNIYKVRGCLKNQLVEIEFVSYPTPFPVPLAQLKALNHLRESSLFRIHKASFKCHKGFYSFNVG